MRVLLNLKHVFLNHLGYTRSGPNTILGLVRKSLGWIVIQVVYLIEMERWISWLEVEFDLIFANRF